MQRPTVQSPLTAHEKSLCNPTGYTGFYLSGGAPLWTTTRPIRFSHGLPVSHPLVTFSRRPGRTRFLTPSPLTLKKSLVQIACRKLLLWAICLVLLIISKVFTQFCGHKTGCSLGMRARRVGFCRIYNRIIGVKSTIGHFWFIGFEPR